MKHEGDPSPDVSRETPSLEPDVLTAWLGIGLDAFQASLLERYQDWLVSEALAAGGIGPHEVDRVQDRHLLDSLAFVRGIPDDTHSIVDIGTGVGLPGIPIAIALPDTAVTLVDRAGRRVDLVRRAVRILGLSNVTVVQSDVAGLDDHWDCAVFRASLPVDEAASVYRTITAPTGTGLVGVSRRNDRPELPQPPSGVQFTMTDEADGALDSPFWLLTMQRSG